MYTYWIFYPFRSKEGLQRNNPSFSKRAGGPERFQSLSFFALANISITGFTKYTFQHAPVKNTAVRYRWIIENVILPNMETDPLIQTVDTGYMEDLIRSCQKYCKGTEHAVYDYCVRLQSPPGSRDI